MSSCDATVGVGRRFGTACLLLAAACGGEAGNPPDGHITDPTPVVATVALNKITLTFTDVGQADTLQATVKDQFGNTMSGVAVTWKSASSAVAVVDNAGVVTAMGVGSAQLTATAGNKSVSATATMVPMVKTVVIDRSSLTLNDIGLTDTLHATVRDQSANVLTDRPVAWQSSAPAIATVSSTGIVRSAGTGTAQITATANNVTGSASVTIPQFVKTVTLDRSTLTFADIGLTDTLRAVLRDQAGAVVTEQAVEWQSSAPSVATVSSDGVVRTTGLGTAQITATAGNVQASASVTIPPAVKTVTLDRSTLTFADIGLIDTLRAVLRNQAGAVMTGQVVRWESSAPLVATVSSNGVVRTAGLGTAQVTASVGSAQASATVSIPQAVRTIALDQTALSLDRVGQQVTLHATARDQASQPMSGVAFNWTTSDGSVASVSQSGVVTAVAGGVTQIRAIASARSASADVSVSIPNNETVACSGGAPTVLLLVQTDLRSSIEPSLTRFANDLCDGGYTVWVPNALPATPPAIRSYLADAWNRSGHRLTGAFLVGDIPHAYQFVVLHSANPSIPDTREEVISFQYYSDVDGSFSASPGYTSPHPYSFDVHEGLTNWELWIAVLPAYKGSRATTIAALNRYFDKNHEYRTGGPKPPREFLEVNELYVSATPADDDFYLSFMRDNVYSWTPFSNSPRARLYFGALNPTLSVANGYADLRSSVADFFVQDSHGTYLAGGQLTIPLVESTPVNTIFFWSSGCAIGNLDHADNFLSSVLYSPTSAVLVAKGTTNNSGGMGNNLSGYYGHNVAQAMSNGASFGAAMVAHVNQPLLPGWSDREFYFGTPVVLGDPTLKLRP